MLEKRLSERLDRLISKGDKLVRYEPSDEELERYSRAVKADLFDEFDPHPTDAVDDSSFIAWRTQALVFLRNILGKDHPYIEEFERHVRDAWKADVKAGQDLLRVVREDIEDGYLTDIRALVAAEVFTDFLDMAKHLRECGYKDPSAFLAGAVLENGLGRIAHARGCYELQPGNGSMRV